MKTHHRDFVFESDDFDKLCQYVIDDYTIRAPEFSWSIGRIIDWKYNLYLPEKHFPDLFGKACHLWLDENQQLLGFVIQENFNFAVWIICHEPYMYLYGEMIAWIKENWLSLFGKVSIEVTESERELADLLIESGFSKTVDIEMTRIFDTDAFKDFVISSSGIIFQSLSENPNYEEHATLRGSAWRHDFKDKYGAGIRAYLRRSPIYNPETDFVLVNSDGRFVSGCEAFIDRKNGYAEIERVCTHAEFTNRGYAKTVIRACLRRLNELGIRTACLTGDYDKTIYLYGSLGHMREFTTYRYEISS